MYKINKVNIATGEKTQVPFPSNALFDCLEECGYDPADVVMKIDHSFPKTNKEAQAALEDELVNGFEGFEKAFAGSGDLRTAKHIALKKGFVEKFHKWWHCGVNTRKNIVANKSIVYDALCMSSSHKWEEATALPPISIDNVAIVKDVEVDVEGVFDVIENGDVKRQHRVVKNKISDGIAIGIVNDDDISHFDRIEMRKNFSPFTIRAPGFKGLVTWILKSDLVAFLDKRGYGYEIKDYWGNPVDIRNLQLIAGASVFKWTKCCDSWQQYVNGFKKNRHAFRVCVVDHNNVSDLPYQQFQTLLAPEEDTNKLADRSIQMMSEFEDIHKAPYLLTKDIGVVAKIYPALMNEPYVAEELQKTYTSKRQKLAGGRIPNVCHYRFAAPDIVAVLEGIYGKKVVGAIPMRRIVCNAIKKDKRVDITRCPHLDNAHVLRRAYEPEQIEANLFTGKTVFFSCHDAAMNAMQMDFDGDHVAVCENEDIINLAEKAIKKIKNVPLYYEAKGSKPGDVTDEQINKLLANITPAPVGLYANGITKIWAQASRIEMNYDKKIMVALLTEAGNTCIDAAKYITGDAESMQDSKTTLIMRKMRHVKKPMFLAYAKTSAQDHEAFGKFAAKCQIYDSCVDQYSQRIIREVPPVLVVDDLEELKFDWHVLTSGKACRKATEGLITSKAERALGEEGFFNKLAYRKANEWVDAANSGNAAVISEFKQGLRDEIREAVFNWANDHGYDAATVIDSIIMMVHIQTKSMPKVTAQLKRVLWIAFGTEILQNVKANIENGIVPGSISEFSEEEYNDDVEGLCFVSDEEDMGFSDEYCFEE